MPFMPAEPIATPTYQSMQFNGSIAHAAEIAWAIDSGLSGRLLVRARIEGFQEGETPPQWRIILQRPDGSPELVAEAGAWIVVVSTGVIRVLDDTAYRLEFVTEGTPE